MIFVYIDASIACQVISESTEDIINAEIDTQRFAEKLLAKTIISERESNKIRSYQTDSDKWTELLKIIKATVRGDGSVFSTFLDMIKEGGTLREKNLAKKLLTKYKEVIKTIIKI